MNQNSRIVAATNCLRDAQVYLDEVLLHRIIDAADHADARDVLYLAGLIQKIQRNISAVTKDICRLPE